MITSPNSNSNSNSLVRGNRTTHSRVWASEKSHRYIRNHFFSHHIPTVSHNLPRHGSQYSLHCYFPTTRSTISPTMKTLGLLMLFILKDVTADDFSIVEWFDWTHDLITSWGHGDPMTALSWSCYSNSEDLMTVLCNPNTAVRVAAIQGLGFHVVE